MTEAYAVESRLTLSTNVEQVLQQLIEQFDDFDKVVKDSQDQLVRFGKETGEIGKEGGLSLKASFQGLKMPNSLLGDLSKVCDFGKGFATSSSEAARAWKEIADASRSIRNPPPPSSGGSRGSTSAGDDSSGGSGRRRKAGEPWTEFQYDQAEQANERLDLKAYRANADLENQDFEARTKFQQKLMQDEQAAVLKEIAQREKSEDAREKIERDLLSAEQKAVLSEIAVREKFEDEKQAEERKLLAAEQKAVLGQISAREKAQADQDRLEQSLLADEQKAVLQSISAREKNDAAQQAAWRTASERNEKNPSGVYGPLPLNEAIQGRPEERADAEAENAWYSSNAQLKAAYQRQLERDGKTPKSESWFGQSKHEFGEAAMGLQMGGDAIMDKVKESLKAGFDFEHLMAIITNDMRVTPDQEKELRGQVDIATKNNPAATPSQALEVFTDLKNTFGDFDEAKKELEPMLKLVTTLQMADLKQGGSGDMHQALSMGRFIEDQGGAVNPATGKYEAEKFDEIAQKAVSIYVATQGRVAPSDMLSFQKMARTGGMMMDDHALYQETPYFAQGFGASKLGTAIFSDVQVMLANRMTDKTADQLGEVGLYTSKHMVGKGSKAHQEWDQSTLKDADILRSDPYKWIHDTLGHSIAETLHVDEKTKEGQMAVLDELTKAAQRGTIAGLWGDVYRNYRPAQKEGENIAHQSTDAQGHFMKDDPMAQMLVLRSAEEKLMVTVGELLKGPALQLIQSFTDSLHGLSDFLNNNPNLAPLLIKTTAAVGIGMTVLGNAGMALMLGAPAFKLIASGLTGLAGALVPFEAGGAAAAGLAGLEKGAAGLAAAVSGGALSKAPLKSVLFGGPAAVMAAGAVLGFEGAKASGTDIAKHAEQGQTPLMMDDFGNAIGYYSPKKPDDIVKKPDPNSLVSPNTSSSAGTSMDPLYVHVLNQLSGNDIARGTAANMASKMNRPPSGYTGTDSRLDPLQSFYAPFQQ